MVKIVSPAAWANSDIESRFHTGLVTRDLLQTPIGLLRPFTYWYKNVFLSVKSGSNSYATISEIIFSTTLVRIYVLNLVDSSALEVRARTDSSWSARRAATQRPPSAFHPAFIAAIAAVATAIVAAAANQCARARVPPFQTDD